MIGPPPAAVTVTADTPAELATRLRALADALTGGPATSALPDVPPNPTPQICSMHGDPLRYDEWTAKSGKACRAWRCPQSTVDSDCTIVWAS